MKKGIIEINRSCSEIESRYNKQSITIVMTMKSEVDNFYEKNKTLLVDWWWCIRHHVRRANKTQQRSYCNKINFCVFSTSREQSTWRPIKKSVPQGRHVEPHHQRPGVFLLSRTTLRSHPPRHTTFADRRPDSLRSRQNVPGAFFSISISRNHFSKTKKKRKLKGKKQKRAPLPHHAHRGRCEGGGEETHDFCFMSKHLPNCSMRTHTLVFT